MYVTGFEKDMGKDEPRFFQCSVIMTNVSKPLEQHYMWEDFQVVWKQYVPIIKKVDLSKADIGLWCFAGYLEQFISVNVTVKRCNKVRPTFSNVGKNI